MSVQGSPWLEELLSSEKIADWHSSDAFPTHALHTLQSLCNLLSSQTGHARTLLIYADSHVGARVGNSVELEEMMLEKNI